MKQMVLKISSAIVFIVSPSIAYAQDPSPETPQARACMAKNGFTYEQWRAYQVGPRQAAAYRSCVAAANARYTSGKVLASEPPPRALDFGQTVYVSCGGGKSRSVTGGNSSQPRTYGECK